KPVMMEEDVDLPNGTTLLRDGTIRMSDGTTKTMQNGDRIALDGTMSHDHAGHSGMDHSQMKDQPAKGKMKMKEDKMKVKDRESDSKVKYDK
ncbi:MAG TPA: DUF6799 domain-containing protein, partial [Adhaeribacter sp.]|nr:DUF6799 domain-containing protein [Adhaeribacter sp.]